MAQTIGSIDLASLKNLRDDVTQYFWFESDSSSAWGSGAHVTLYPESQFTDSTSPNYMKGQNIIMNTDGFSIRNGGLPMMVLDNDSLDFNAIDTSLGTYTTMATFGLNGVQIGQINGGNFVIDGNGMQMRDGNQNVLANFSLNEVQIGASNESNITITGNGILGNSSVGNMFGIYPDGTSISRSISTYVYMYDQYTPTIETIDLLDNISNGNTFTAKITPRRSSYTTSGTYTLTKGTPQTINAPVNYNYAKLTYDGDKTIEFGWVSGVMWYDVEIKVVTTTPAPYYTFGYREDDSTNGAFSMSIGVNNEPSGNYTFTHGADLVADHALQFAIGRWNDYLSATDALFIIGNGTALQRSNALIVDWGGVTRIAGSLFTQCNDNSTGGYEFSRKASNHIVIGGYHVCWGRETISHTGSGYKEVQVTLPYTYTSAPYCFASYGNRPTGGAPRTAYSTQSNLAGNKIYVGSYATGSVDAYVNWMTIGV